MTSSTSRRVPRPRRALDAVGIAGITLAMALGATACGGSETTKEDFVDHAVEFSTAARSDDDQAYIRTLFECVWEQVKDDGDLVDDFMAADSSDDELSAEMSSKMGPCVTEQAGVTIPDAPIAEATTTVPAG